MARSTIDFGIDLGTTNSAIAVLNGTEVEVFKDNEGFECTPSAVWIDKVGRLQVGRRARESYEVDRENAAVEFKLQMGAGVEYTFARSGRKMRPEELSAEVLKSLKADVRQRSGEDLTAAVITVPAAFELPQCEATRRAAQQAGLVSSPLLQEPAAAALAYGFQSESEKVFWLVYDFGGGTFDAAVVQVRDGAITVVNHAGDNQLGGKLIDWEIVEQLLIPAARGQARFSDFRRGAPKWASAIAKLKYHAELAKIRVSRGDAAEIVIDFLCNDDGGSPVSFEYELKRSDVERLAEPYIFRSINICRRALAEKRLGAGVIEKTLLVGGPTLMPYLRERLADPREGLGIPLEFGIDPMTVVARGAAIFAGTQRLESAALVLSAGRYAVELEYSPVGEDPEPLVGGRVRAAGSESLDGFTIEFVNAEARPPWRSGKIGLSPDGAFMTNLWAEKGRANHFLIELCDAAGVKRQTTPDGLSYTVGVVFTAPPLIHSVGVALADNEMEWLLLKGTPLPARRRAGLRTAIELRRGQAGHALRIPVMEGRHQRADRNQHIGSLEIAAENIQRDLPANSEVQVTIEIDQSRLVRARAYIPMLDEEFEKVISYDGYRDQARDAAKLAVEAAAQKERLAQAREKAVSIGDEAARQSLRRIDAERMAPEVESALAAADSDHDAADKCEKRLLDLKVAIDEVEDALEWPALVADAEREIEQARRIINAAELQATSAERSSFASLEREARGAITARDPDLLRRKIQELNRLSVAVLLRQPGFWAAQLELLERKKAVMSNPAQAENYFAQGRRAINSNDFDTLRFVVRQLVGLLPAGDTDRARILSDVLR